MSSETYQVSPSKDSPSRRKRLMGSLRSMGSLRGLRLSPVKDRARERTDEPLEPLTSSSLVDHVDTNTEPQSPCPSVLTPKQASESRPSLMLNFERTPPDQPMFGVLRRKPSSSSLAVLHSSPIPIPTPARIEDVPLGVPTYTMHVPDGTVPDTPGPLQMAMERDAKKCSTDSKPIPVLPKPKGPAEPLPTPMPGTNLGLEINDVDAVPVSRIEQRASFSEPTSEPSSYFAIPVANESTRPETHETNYDAEQRLDIAAQEAYLVNTMPDERAMNTNLVAEAAKPGMHVPQAERCELMLPGCLDHDEKAQHTPIAGRGRYICDRCQVNERVTLDPGSSPIGIEHIVFSEEIKNMSADKPPSHRTYMIQQAQAQMNLQKMAMASNREAFPVLGQESRPAQSSWGTHGSLYDGNGYGDASSSSSDRASTSSTVPKAGLKPTAETGFTAASLSDESAAIAREHEMLEEVIRAYANFEEEGSSGISDEVLEEIAADVKLADKMANNSLGA